MSNVPVQFLCHTAARWRRTTHRSTENTFRKQANLHAVGNETKSQVQFSNSKQLVLYACTFSAGTFAYYKNYIYRNRSCYPHCSIFINSFSPKRMCLEAFEWVYCGCGPSHSQRHNVVTLYDRHGEFLQEFGSTAPQIVDRPYFISYRMQISLFSERVLRSPMGGATPSRVSLI